MKKGKTMALGKDWPNGIYWGRAKENWKPMRVECRGGEWFDNAGHRIELEWVQCCVGIDQSIEKIHTGQIGRGVGSSPVAMSYIEKAVNGLKEMANNGPWSDDLLKVLKP